jgi:hypothetical protein
MWKESLDDEVFEFKYWWHPVGWLVFKTVAKLSINTDV